MKYEILQSELPIKLTVWIDDSAIQRFDDDSARARGEREREKESITWINAMMAASADSLVRHIVRRHMTHDRKHDSL